MMAALPKQEDSPNNMNNMSKENREEQVKKHNIDRGYSWVIAFVAFCLQVQQVSHAYQETYEPHHAKNGF